MRQINSIHCSVGGRDTKRRAVTSCRFQTFLIAIVSLATDHLSGKTDQELSCRLAKLRVFNKLLSFELSSRLYLKYGAWIHGLCVSRYDQTFWAILEW